MIGKLPRKLKNTPEAKAARLAHKKAMLNPANRLAAKKTRLAYQKKNKAKLEKEGIIYRKKLKAVGRK